MKFRELRMDGRGLFVGVILMSGWFFQAALGEEPALNQQFLHTRFLDKGQAPASGQLQDIGWIAGQWQGQALGGTFQEIWTSPMGDNMMGSFRLIVDQKAKFYEILLIRQVEDTLLFQLKHFDSALKGWETKEETIDFPLVAMNEDTVWFDGCTFERISDHEMHVYVVVAREPEIKELKFVYHRQKGPGVRGGE